MKTNLLFALLWMPSVSLSFQKPAQGRVKIYVSADSNAIYKGVAQRSSDLDESTRDVRRGLNKSKWLEVVETAEDADIRLRVLGRRKDADRGFILGYALDAGAFKTEEEFAYQGESHTTGGGRSRDARGMDDDMSPRATKSWTTLAQKFAQSLEGFAQANYDRIVAQRKQ